MRHESACGPSSPPLIAQIEDPAGHMACLKGDKVHDEGVGDTRSAASAHSSKLEMRRIATLVLGTYASATASVGRASDGCTCFSSARRSSPVFPATTARRAAPRSSR